MLPYRPALAIGMLIGVSVAGCWPLAAQSTPTADPPTRPERTDFRETSSYADVMALAGLAAERSPQVYLTTFGYSFEGRPLPLVVVGHVAGPDPRAVHESGRTRVLVLANIHAGEVSGKEATLMLIRALAAGAHDEWLDSLVLLIAPIYNADGNERVRLTNRPGQYGPIGGMGQRANAQDLDLNRDNMKLESPEARSLVSALQRWDPHVLMDLHTTNGTRRSYHLLYAPPLHPNTDSAIVRQLRSDWLPAVTRRIKETSGWDFYYYGNVPFRAGSAERGWYTFDHRPRFTTNYVGLRNRFAILSEAYAYASFRERVASTLRFVEEVVEYAHRNASLIATTVAAADSTDLTGSELALSATVQRSDSVEILLGEVAEERHPYTGRTMYRRLDVVHRERMPDFGSFRGTEVVRVPTAYIVPSDLTSVLTLLDAHGVERRPLARSMQATVERFVIDSMSVAGREYQGHAERTLYGRYEQVELDVPVGAVLVPVAQPLARLIVALLEPRSDDGLVNWNVLDGVLDGARHYPILRVPAP
ncbi:MAG: M14 family metallopeptidase [Gemmatimonadota bacterium]|nr:M14 family metallopeptidase [Gemmatimonadota bacterium]